MAERPEDLNLPSSVVARIIKESLPGHVNISKDAKLAISKAASVFVLYSTSCANNFAQQHKRKTISAQDVYEAMKEMEFNEFIVPLQDSLEAYKANQKDRKEMNDRKKKETNDEKDGERLDENGEMDESEGSEEEIES